MGLVVDGVLSRLTLTSQLGSRLHMPESVVVDDKASPGASYETM